MNCIKEYQLIFNNTSRDKKGIPGLLTLESKIQQFDKIYDKIVINHKTNGSRSIKGLNWILCQKGRSFNLWGSEEWLFLYSTGFFIKKWKVCILVHNDLSETSEGLKLFNVRYKIDFNGIVSDRDLIPNFKLISYSNDGYLTDDTSYAYKFIHSYLLKINGN